MADLMNSPICVALAGVSFLVGLATAISPLIAFGLTLLIVFGGLQVVRSRRSK